MGTVPEVKEGDFWVDIRKDPLDPTGWMKRVVRVWEVVAKVGSHVSLVPWLLVGREWMTSPEKFREGSNRGAGLQLTTVRDLCSICIPMSSLQPDVQGPLETGSPVGAVLRLPADIAVMVADECHWTMDLGIDHEEQVVSLQVDLTCKKDVKRAGKYLKRLHLALRDGGL